MSNVAKLKKRALDYEQKKQFDKAIETYAQVLAELDDQIDEADVALYNRVGDLLLRRGDVSSAVDHYEKAVDLYTEGGFFTNAIALCNKILRNAPGRNSIYYKLGKISARKGFTSDAKQKFLEYADRMQRTGQFEEAFRALKEFADLCPDQDDIRLMLADQLVRSERKGEAIEQLQLLYEKFDTQGRAREARATLERMRTIDPDLQPKQSVMRPTPKANDLIFLDVNYDAPGQGAAPSVAPAAHATPAGALDALHPAELVEAAAVEEQADEMAAGVEMPLAHVTESLADVELPLIEIDHDDELAAETVEGLTPGARLMSEDDAGTGIVSNVDSDFITGFEQTTLDDEVQDGPSVEFLPIADLEATVFETVHLEEAAGESAVPSGDLELILPDDLPPLGESDTLQARDPLSAAYDMLEASTEDEAEPAGGELTLIYPEDPPLAPVTLSDVPEGTATASAESAAPIAAPEPHGEFELHSEEAQPADAPPVEYADEAPASPPPDVRVVDRLRAELESAPDDWELHRRYGEALLEDGARAEGLISLEAAMLGYERCGDLRRASAMVDELVLVEPSEVRFHQKRVEYAVRANDKVRLADAYVALADSLFRMGQLDKSRAVYQRVLELAPSDERIHDALRAMEGEEGVAPIASSAPTSVPQSLEGAAALPVPRPREAEPSLLEEPAEGFVDLAEWLREEEPVRNTRMVVDVLEPQSQAQVDFAEMLSMFKQGIAANVDEADHESHYDLGVAYKEMGLLDEAISEFQKALRGTEQRVRTYEALGQCFVEKGQFQIALTILTRALGDKSATDDMLVGVLYLLGYASEALGRWADAGRFYERVFAVDIQFRDIGDRLAAVESKAR